MFAGESMFAGRFHRLSQAAACSLVALLAACGSTGNESPPPPQAQFDAIGQALRPGCRTLTLTASKSHGPDLWSDADVTLERSLRLAIPAELPVVAGNAGAHRSTLTVTTPGGVVTCRYKSLGNDAAPRASNPSDEGHRYAFHDCSTGARPGDVVEAGRLVVHVNDGSWKHGRTEVRLQIEEQEPCADLCAGLTAAELDDGDPCTTDSCEPSIGVSHAPAEPGTTCGDGDLCNGDEVCDAAATCIGGTPPPVDDGNPCSVDSCDPVAGVLHLPVAVGTWCGTDNVCYGVCDDAGQCLSEQMIDVDDGNPCTVDDCIAEEGGPVHWPNGFANCDDGNVCNGLSTCTWTGDCVAPGPVSFDDGNPCTADSCDPLTGITHLAVSAGTACADADACNGTELCDAAGRCTAQPAPIVIDDDPCTRDLCSAATGVEHVLLVDCTDTPPDPKLHAPALDLTQATRFEDAIRFLYSGPHRVQYGLDESALEQKRTAVIRGRVLHHDGTPFASVAVSAPEQPELGVTFTRVDGEFDLVVNGGGPVVVRLERAGHISAERRVDTGWRDYVVAPDVVLVPYDAAATRIEFGTSAGWQVARGRVETDGDGTRQATLLFAPGTRAELELANGTRVAAGELHVRATEFTVGERGREAMPADLPPTTAYTYAVDLSADEAVAQHARSVRFSSDTVLYVENFLRSPVGTPVPLGHYDVAKHGWIGMPNGLVLAITGLDSGVAAVDLDGDGVPESDSVLVAAGISAAERGQLAGIYTAPIQLWRATMNHFTPFDLNYLPGWLQLAPGSAGPPSNLPPWHETPLDNPTCRAGSIIECENRTLREVLPLNGTPFQLAYSSERAPGRAVVIHVPLDSSVDNTIVRRILVRVEVAGRTLESVVLPGGERFVDVAWDGRDAFGRIVQGGAEAIVSVGHELEVGYTYPAGQRLQWAIRTPEVTSISALFDRYTGRGLTTAWSRVSVALERWSAPDEGLGGWSIDVHHRYDPNGHVLYMGDGTRRAASAIGESLFSVLGGDGPAWDRFNTPLQPWSATDLRFGVVGGLAFGPDGAMYLSEPDYDRVRVVRGDYVEHVAGDLIDRSTLVDFCGDGGPSTDACLLRPTDLAVDADGTLFIVDSGNYRIRKVDQTGSITTVVGSGSPVPANLEGALGTASFAPHRIALGRDGTLFVADLVNGGILAVHPDGRREVLAGFLSGGLSGDGVWARDARVESPVAIAAGPDGSVVYAEQWTGRVRRIGPDGVISTIANSSVNPRWTRFSRLAFDRAGRLLILADLCDESALLRLNSAGKLERLAGRVEAGKPLPTATCNGWGDGGNISPDGTLALDGELRLGTLAVAPDGSIHFDDYYFVGRRIRHLVAPLPGFGASDIAIASGDGAQVYQFNANGRHLATFDALTGQQLFGFSYDERGRVAAVVDTYGNTTTLERDMNDAVVVVGPFGERTRFGFDATGLLSTVTNAAGETTALGYGAGALLTSLTDARGGLHAFRYDAAGRLLSDADPLGGTTGLSAVTGDASTVTTVTSAMGLVTTHRDSHRAGAVPRSSLTTGPDGLVHQSELDASGASFERWPDGTLLIQTREANTRFGPIAPNLSSTLTTPWGRTLTSTTIRTASGYHPAQPWRATTVTETRVVGSSATVTTYDASTGLRTTTSAGGRTVVEVLDAFGRVVEVRAPGVLPVTASYDGRGRLNSVAQGTRAMTVTYGADGRVQSLTDPLGRSATLVRDTIGRVVSQVRPDGSAIGVSYDANGNVTAVTPPGRPPHAFAYDAVDQEVSYSPPDLPSTSVDTTFAYDLDHKPTLEARPDGRTILPGYDFAGRLSRLTTSEGETTFDYSPTSGRLATITAPSGQSTEFTFDGPLLASELSSGVASGFATFLYDQNFQLQYISQAGSFLQMERDADGLLTSLYDYYNPAVQLGIVRDQSSGRRVGSYVGLSSDGVVYDEYGEWSGYHAAFDGTPLFDVGCERDALGRITTKIETLDGVTTTYGYDYDLLGRLEHVWRNGTLESSYAYDANGNRLARTSSSVEVASYDAQDRLLTYGPFSYSYTAHGTLSNRTDGRTGETAFLQYDTFGNLARYTRPDGTVIEYVVDGLKRRVAKLVDGSVTRRWLWLGQLRPLAELDGSGNVLSRFVYTTGVNVPELMVRDGRVYRLVKDHLGSVRMVVDTQTGAVAQRLDYDEFGVVLADSNPGFQPFGFAGGLYDPDTGLVRFGARDYDAMTGRWTAKDPIGFRGGDTNQYAYVGSRPVDVKDPTGLWVFGLGVDFTAHLVHIGVDVSLFVVVDGTGNLGFAFTPAGRFGLGLALGLNPALLLYPGAQSIADIAGAGASAGLDLGPVSCAGNASITVPPSGYVPESSPEAPDRVPIDKNAYYGGTVSGLGMGAGLGAYVSMGWTFLGGE